jgi:hypothetical protein
LKESEELLREFRVGHEEKDIDSFSKKLQISSVI